MRAASSLKSLSLLLLATLIVSCTGKKADPTMTRQKFGTTPDGRDAWVYTLRNASGMEARITNLGGVVLSLLAPDKDGRFTDIVLGYDSLSRYVVNKPYFGALIGRYGNRIGQGKFSLEGVDYTLATNNGPNHLHGGVTGFDKVVWDAEEVSGDGEVGVKLSRVSPDMEEGYPGDLAVKVTYTLTDSNELKIEYRATTDRPTVVNLTQHSYFNLAGEGQGDILTHDLMIAADQFTPTDSGLIPTGELRQVGGTPMDFTSPVAIGARIGEPYDQLALAGGYDHNWVLNKPSRQYGLAARVYERTTGRVMEVLTTEPGLQFYSGNFLDGTEVGKGGKVYRHRYGFCLETQHFPDSPNKPGFPPTTLRPGEEYFTVTAYRFSVRP